MNFVDPTGLVSDEEEVIRIETRAPRWVDDFWLRHALGVLFGAGQRVRLWTEYEPRAGGRDGVPTLVQGQHNVQLQRPLAKNKTLISAAELAASVRKNSAPSRKLL
ncbi:hypothetical protein [Pyrinomonas methylaliphatogenes]|uniref:Uncharacterized protein n=1 Tax=Pyrinomonas methylaliphatogenes TaxID=454194 RepID=A0A0B6WVX4_9BACT|nr:hypothetical protein [Pyrinomonas methylaliphatogenes]CDM64902.1 hypothetical protein PYK22_00897 [Pyrinomonas methylaliphatogenes]